MEWKTTKKATDINLDGITAIVESEDTSIKSVVLTDAKGNKVRFACEYWMRITIPAPPVMVKRFRLEGVVAGLPVKHDFDDRYAATAARDDYRMKVREEDDAKLEVSEVEVPEAA